MMNYIVKYSIANCVFGYTNEAQLQADTAYIGIFSLSKKGMYELNFDDIDMLASVTGAITIRSALGGGIGLPLRDRVFEILQNDHNDLIRTFIDTISEKNIVLFDDGEMYAPVMMKIILQMMKEAGKKVTVICVIPPKYEGRRRRREFDISWSEIESMADESILQDLSFIYDDTESKTLDDMRYLQRYEPLKTIANRWKLVDEKWKRKHKKTEE